MVCSGARPSVTFAGCMSPTDLLRIQEDLRYAIDARKAGLAAECMSTPRLEWRDLNGKIVSVIEFAVTRFKEGLELKLSGGSSRISVADRRKAEFEAKQFRASMDDLVADVA